MALLEVRGLTKYFGGLAAVSDLDFDISKGELVGLIGPNGAGKTTLFNTISGVCSPSRGRVIFKGEDITGLKPHKIAEKGMVRTFQLTSLFKNKTTLENVIVAHHLQSKTGFWGTLFNTPTSRREENDNKQKAIEILENLGLSPVKDKIARNLPYGQQRALGMAIALAAEPELLMLDEPVTGMNQEEIMNAMALIKRIQERGITILLVEHNMRVVMGFCERIIVLNYGKKIAEGQPKEIRGNKQVIEAYLGVEGYVT